MLYVCALVDFLRPDVVILHRFLAPSMWMVMDHFVPLAFITILLPRTTTLEEKEEEEDGEEEEGLSPSYEDGELSIPLDELRFAARHNCAELASCSRIHSQSERPREVLAKN